jgi:hypothetical protein
VIDDSADDIVDKEDEFDEHLEDRSDDNPRAERRFAILFCQWRASRRAGSLHIFGIEMKLKMMMTNNEVDPSPIKSIVSTLLNLSSANNEKRRQKKDYWMQVLKCRLLEWLNSETRRRGELRVWGGGDRVGTIWRMLNGRGVKQRIGMGNGGREWETANRVSGREQQVTQINECRVNKDEQNSREALERIDFWMANWVKTNRIWTWSSVNVSREMWLVMMMMMMIRMSNEVAQKCIQVALAEDSIASVSNAIVYAICWVGGALPERHYDFRTVIRNGNRKSDDEKRPRVKRPKLAMCTLPAKSDKPPEIDANCESVFLCFHAQ